MRRGDGTERQGDKTEDKTVLIKKQDRQTEHTRRNRERGGGASRHEDPIAYGTAVKEYREETQQEDIQATNRYVIQH